MALAGAPEAVPDDRFIDGIDQTSFLLSPDGASNRKYHYYWLGQAFSGLRCGEYKWMMNGIGDDPISQHDVHGTGGFSGVVQKYPYGRLFNLYLDPKESHSYMIRKLAYQEALVGQVGKHLRTFSRYPAKLIVGINV
jgi:arylsulfatase